MLLLERKVHNPVGTNETVFFGDHIFQGRSVVSALFEKNKHSDKIPYIVLATLHLFLDMIYTVMTGIVTDMKDLKALKDLGVSTHD